MQHTSFFGISLVVGVFAFTVIPQTATAQPAAITSLLNQLSGYRVELTQLQSRLASLSAATAGATDQQTTKKTVPFYSQFADISDPAWQKVGCGIASVAMLIDYYIEEPLPESVDDLLARGRERGAYLQHAGWTHAGLINLSRDYGLTGRSVSLTHLSKEAALAEFARVVAEGPVMASVHYTFEPTNPIPHLVVIHGVKDGQVYYNDPAEPRGYGSISKERFWRAWKQRYISIRPDERLAYRD